MVCHISVWQVIHRYKVTAIGVQWDQPIRTGSSRTSNTEHLRYGLRAGSECDCGIIIDASCRTVNRITSVRTVATHETLAPDSPFKHGSDPQIVVMAAEIAPSTKLIAKLS